MIQKFIELGEGYSDIYELLEIGKANKSRIARLMTLNTKIGDAERSSFVVILNPTNPGDFQPMYICREGISHPDNKPNKRFELFEGLASDLGKNIIQLEVKSSQTFAEKELYYQYLIGILRMNRYIQPMS